MTVRILLISLLLCAAPLAAQRSAADVPPLRSGTPVRVFLQPGSPEGAEGVLLGGTRDTLLLVSPALGLARLTPGDVERLETMGRGSGAGRYALYVLGLSTALGLAGGGEIGFFPMFMNGVVIFGIGGGVAYALEPPRRAISIDPAGGLPEVRQDPARPGVPVRISTASLPAAAFRMHDFSADSVYLFAEGRSTPIARTEIRSLRVSTGRDRRRGVRLGGRAGAIAGALVGTAWAVRESGSEWALVVAPVVALTGAGVGWLAGAPAGWALAPRRWEDVPVHAPQR